MSAWAKASHGVFTDAPPKAAASSETVMFSAARWLETWLQVTAPAMRKTAPAMIERRPARRTKRGFVTVDMMLSLGALVGPGLPGPGEPRGLAHVNIVAWPLGVLPGT